MHELSLVLSIVEIAREQAKIHSADRIESIELEIGELAGVETDALLFAWDAAVLGTVLDDSERIVRQIPGKARCSDCRSVYGVHSLFDTCPDCGACLSEVLEGRELRVRSLVVSRRSMVDARR